MKTPTSIYNPSRDPTGDPVDDGIVECEYSVQNAVIPSDKILVVRRREGYEYMSFSAELSIEKAIERYKWQKKRYKRGY